MNISEAINIFHPTITEQLQLKQDCIDNIQYIIETTPSTSIGIRRDWVEYLAKELNEEITEIELLVRKLFIEEQISGYMQTIKRINSNIQHKNKPTNQRITDLDIQRAREVPIQNMLDTQIFKSAGKWIGCTYCPLLDHKGERTPSFFIDKNNKWKCFGCQAFGDAIELHMKLNGVKFIQAVKSLQ